MAYPTSALVAVAWLGNVFAPAMVATTLPRDFRVWAATGFVQVTPIPAAADVDGMRRLPILQLDFWTASIDNAGQLSDKLPRGRAAELAERFVVASEGRTDDVVTLPAGYTAARVLAMIPETEPTEVPDDPSGYARFTCDAALHWARI